MDKQITGGELALKSIFSKEYLFEIPNYQRPYSWTIEETATLFDDLYNFYKIEKEDIYFLGSIVLIKNHTSPIAQVVDGQQRLTTLTILFAAMASLFSSSSIKEEVRKYIREPGMKVERIAPQSRLKLRDKDKEYFEKYVQSESFLELAESKPQTEAQGNIKENAAELVKKLKNKFDSDDELLSFASFIVTRCYLVVVATPNTQSAFRVFSVMNSRGLDLLPCDIVKADIIGKIKDVAKQQKYTDKWETLEVQIERAGFNDLFGHIRMIYARTKAQNKLLEEFSTYVLSAPENKEPTEFIDKTLEPLCNAYYDIKMCDYESSKNAEEINDNLKWLAKINNSDWIPAAILFFSKHSNDSFYLLWFVKKLERLAAYLHITAYDVNSRILRYAEIIKEIKLINSTFTNPIKSIELTQAEQTEFLNALDGEIYKLTPPRRNYAILRLDSFLQGVGAKYEYSVLTIEHVMPQTIADGSEWGNWWSDVDIKRNWLNRIANLVPLARKHNSAAQNYSFETKKKVYFCGTNGVTPYSLTTQVNSMTEWTPEIVVDRQEKLLEIYAEKWELREAQKGKDNKLIVLDSVRKTSFDGQLSASSSAIQEIYKCLCNYTLSLGESIVQDKLKFFTSFKKSKNSFISIKVNRAELILYCKIDFNTITNENGFTRNLAGVGHVSNYNPCVELTIRSETDFEKAKQYIQRAYKEN